jgi:hypothetical protein
MFGQSFDGKNLGLTNFTLVRRTHDSLMWCLRFGAACAPVNHILTLIMATIIAAAVKFISRSRLSSGLTRDLAGVSSWSEPRPVAEK